MSFAAYWRSFQSTKGWEPGAIPRMERFLNSGFSFWRSRTTKSLIRSHPLGAKSCWSLLEPVRKVVARASGLRRAGVSPAIILGRDAPATDETPIPLLFADALLGVGNSRHIDFSAASGPTSSRLSV